MSNWSFSKRAGNNDKGNLKAINISDKQVEARN